jgi:tetratricopeptide (TPR) repeat protein
MRSFCCVLALCGVFVFSSPAAANTVDPQGPPDQSKQDLQVCEGELGGAHAVTADAKIKACSDLLNSGQLTPRGRSLVLVSRSLAYGGQHAEDLEAADLDAATKADPTFAFAWANSCSFHTWQKDLVRATQECSKAIELAPDDPNGWTFRGDTYLASHRFEKAISDYNHAIDLNAKWMWPWDNRGEAYLRLGKIDRAIQDFEMVIELNPDYAMGYIDRGIAHIKQKQLDAALFDFEQGLKVDPKCASCLYGRGIIKGLRGDHIGQAADIQAAKAMNPKGFNNFDEDGVTPN